MQPHLSIQNQITIFNSDSEPYCNVRFRTERLLGVFILESSS